MLQQNVIADRIDERPQAVGLKNLAIAQSHKESGKRLLPHVFDGLRGLQARAQFDLDQRAEVGREMLLDPEVTCSQPAEIGFVERVELQALAPHCLECEKV